MADGNYFDPAWALGADDPLRAWADQNLDPHTGALIASDPRAAIDHMISRGIAPPEAHAPAAAALPFAGDGASTPPSNEPYRLAGPEAMDAWRRGVDAVNSSENAPFKPSVPLPSQGEKRLRVTPDRSPFDPAEEPVPTPTERPAGAPTDVSAQKRPDAGSALADVSKSLAGVKPIQPPALNAVGTPSVRSPGAVTAPNLANLLAMAGQAAPQSTLASLGRLLVQGKA